MTTPEDIVTGTVPSLPRGVRLRHDPARDQWVLLGPERVMELNEIALEILKRCDGQADFGAIVADLSRTFEAEASMVENDVRAFLADLKVRGMLVLS